MKITLDHNCLIEIENLNENGKILKKLISENKHDFFIVNIGSSELRQNGIRPDNYSTFDSFLSDLGLQHLPRLKPMGLIDVTFIDHCIIADENMINLSKRIKQILFTTEIENESYIEQPPYKQAGRKWLNRLCDVHSMWCHIYYGNDIFITSDKNFHKKTKKPDLLSLGAKNIMKPKDFYEKDA